MPAITLPRSPSLLEELGNILGTIGNIPGQAQGQQAALEKQQLELEQLREMQRFRKKVGETLGMPLEVTGPSTDVEIPQLTDEEAGGQITVPGQKIPNKERTDRLKALKEIGPYYGVKQEKTLAETMQEIEARGGQQRELETLKGKHGQELEAARQRGRKEVEQEKTSRTLESTKIKEEGKREISKAEQELRRKQIEINSRKVDTAAAAQLKNAENIDSLITTRIGQLTNYQARTQMMQEQMDDKSAAATSRLLNGMQRQLAQIYKLQQADVNDPAVQAMLQSATDQYKVLANALKDVDSDAPDEVTTLDVAPGIGIMDMLKSTFGVGTPGVTVKPQSTEKKPNIQLPKINVPSSVRQFVPSTITPGASKSGNVSLEDRIRERRKQLGR